ncbi:serine carboxypeptidase-like 50 [Citrus sinensis]|uniref:Serine carboxypeptidase-like 50 n=1 Tax=Citrus sinensis TaxID=2711 RepID=A0ACB8K4L6_CITSI|nr:serine carboxypeptidase-like 50 [Citrus sinensis]
MKSTATVYLLFFFFSLFLRHINTSSSISISSSSSLSVVPKEAFPTRSGYLPVSPATGSAIFYAFYEAQTPTSPLSQTPLLLWLQGGPGCSSMLGNFLEVGPWRVTHRPNTTQQQLALEPNLGSWNRISGIVFLDNPIGTGLSFAVTNDEIPRNQSSVAKHLFAAINGFIDLDPLFKNRPIYVTGESYAGKSIPSIGYHILKQNKRVPVSKREKLHGVAIGNGLTDPVSQVAVHALNAYFIGLINGRQRVELEKAQRKAIRLVKMGSWSDATNARHDSLVTSLLRMDEVKKAFGAKDTITFDVCSNVVMKALHEDLMKSAKFMVEFLVKNTKWEGIESFLMAERKAWRVKQALAGYVQKFGNLSNVVVLGAGHLMPADQPLISQTMIEDWVLDKGLFANRKEN